MTDQHPITPPPELVQQWYNNIGSDPEPFESFAIAAARWGSDQELEACVEWIHDWYGHGSDEVVGNLRTARRPKPPSLKEQALKDFDALMSELDRDGNHSNCTERIRRALEQLDD